MRLKSNLEYTAGLRAQKVLYAETLNG